MTLDLLGVTCRIIVGATLILAGGSKATEIREFAKVLRQFPISRLVLRNEAAARAAASAIGLFEIVSGALFLLGIWPALTGIVIAVALAVFTVALAVGVVRKESLRCGCFGGGSSSAVSWRSVVRNAGLISLTLVGTTLSGAALGVSTSGTPAKPEYVHAEMAGAQLALIAFLLIAYLDLRGKPEYRTGTRGRQVEGELAEVWEGVPAHHHGRTTQGGSLDE
ncbi:MAG: MauE/DoxX family redox-associated membrane protein [Actinomycetota bacterium]